MWIILFWIKRIIQSSFQMLLGHPWLAQPSQIRPQRKASSLILGTGRAGGRPPDDRNLVVLKGRKVVQKPHMRSKLTRGTLGMSSNIFEDRFVDSFEQPDLIEDEENAQKKTGEEKGTSSIVN